MRGQSGGRTPPVLRARTTRQDRPLWSQVIEGIGLVVVLSAVVLAAGAAMALLVSLAFR
jgi:hypothetical protein